MNITSDLTDAAILGEIGLRLARHRVDAGLTQAVLAHEAGVAKSTVERIEQGQATEFGTLIRILRVLKLSAGLDLVVPAPPPSPIALRRNRGRPRRRASSPRAPATPARPWTWAE